MRSRSFLTLCLFAALQPIGTNALAASRSVVLITMDTTRADAIGAYGHPSEHHASTPVLDRLAARGVRYESAFSPAPLTLPAHASLLTGLDPPAHGIRENGVSALPASIPTLATILKARRYRTAAFVSSRVLDHRFGLARGFDVYDDLAPAEQIGEYGYPERNAEQVTTAALSWAASAGAPFFLWVHYYDPHAPYEPPERFRGASRAGDYAGEISFVDSQIGRLMAALPLKADDVIAVAGDHAESLGEHGEETHGIFVYRSALEVPLILAGGAIRKGAVVHDRVSTVGLAQTLLRMAGAQPPRGMASPLPGLGLGGTASPIQYAESFLPASAYGWSPLQAISDQRWHAIIAPRPELYDLEADPDEHDNVIDAHRREYFRLRGLLQAYEKTIVPPREVNAAADGELAAAIRSLGYMSSTSIKGSIDPKDGIALLSEANGAMSLLRRGHSGEAVTILERLVKANPSNVPFLTDLAEAQLAAGSIDQALGTYRRAAGVNPRLDFLHLNLADALRQAGKIDEAVAEYRVALRLNQRLAAAAIRLSEIAEGQKDTGSAIAELRRAAGRGTHSASISTRLARLEMNRDELVAAERDAREAIRIASLWTPAWIVLGEILERKRDPDGARRAYETAATSDRANPAPVLKLAELARKHGEMTRARRLLESILVNAPRSSEAAEARRILERSPQ